MSFRMVKEHKIPEKKADIGLFDTDEKMGQILYTGDYVKLVDDIIEYVHNASLNEEYFRVLLLKRLFVYVRISDLYLLGLKRVKKMVESLLKKKQKEDGKKRKRKMEEEDEKVWVFGRKENNPERYFKNADFLGFSESHSGATSRIGRIALNRAIYDIFAKVNEKSTRSQCERPIFTIVYMACEAARFDPVFYYSRIVEDVVPAAWFGKIVTKWEKMTKRARRKTSLDTYEKPPKLLDDKWYADLKNNPAWNFDILTVRHGHQGGKISFVFIVLLRQTYIN